MAENSEEQQKKKGVSKTGLLLGAAGLFLFIVGVKRTFRPDDVPADAPRPASGEGAGSSDQG